MQYAEMESKTGFKLPYAFASGPELPPPYSVGWNVTCENFVARCDTCWPVPEASSRHVAGAVPENGGYLASTLAMGSLFRSAAGAHCMALSPDAPNAVRSARRLRRASDRGAVALSLRRCAAPRAERCGVSLSLCVSCGTQRAQRVCHRRLDWLIRTTHELNGRSGRTA